MLGAIFERFVEQSPMSVMVRGLMERVFAPEQINRIFEDNAKVQYTRELLFSSLVELMSLVVCGIQRSVNAYRAKASQLNVSRTAVYDKLNSFLKLPRTPKNKKDPPLYDPRHPHISTAKLLAKAKKSL